jgi:hypothetical protein
MRQCALRAHRDPLHRSGYASQNRVHGVCDCMWPLTRLRVPVLARKNIVDGNIQFELGHYHSPTMVSVHTATARVEITSRSLRCLPVPGDLVQEITRSWPVPGDLVIS